MPNTRQDDTPDAALPGERADAAPIPPRRRPKRRWALLGLIPAVTAGALLATLWTGARLHEQPFVWYNLNRIDALADRAARSLAPVTVVALGDTALRDSTLDEAGMTALAAKQGVKGLHFLRIVHNRAEFADFEPLLDRLLAAKPTLVLIDRALLTAEREVVEDLTRYARVLAGLPDGRPYLQDQVALQYRRSCAAPEPAAQAPMAESADAAERVRAFMDRAWAAGIQVALVQVRGRPDATLPTGTETLPLWHNASLTNAAGTVCSDDGRPGEVQAAFSSWLAGGVASLLASSPRPNAPRPARTEAAALP